MYKNGSDNADRKNQMRNNTGIVVHVFVNKKKKGQCFSAVHILIANSQDLTTTPLKLNEIDKLEYFEIETLQI